ncbi:hypothetical protein ACWC2T_24080 [Streptomyces sp. NPDC001393]
MATVAALPFRAVARPFGRDLVERGREPGPRNDGRPAGVPP